MRGVVVPCHLVFATSVACHPRAIPAFHSMVGVMGANGLRCVPYATFELQELSDVALVALADWIACLLGQHGQIALGRMRSQRREWRWSGEAGTDVFAGAGDHPDAADVLGSGV